MTTLSRICIAITLVATLLAVPGPSEAQSSGDQSTSSVGFLPRDDYFTDGEPFADETIAGLLETLDGLLSQPAVQRDFERVAGNHLMTFTNRLTMGRMMPAHVARVVRYLDDLAAAHPDHAVMIGRYRYTVAHLMIGSLALNIVGKDLDGVEFELADYRGKIVALVFTGHWCAPCRAEYPYQRLLLEVMAGEPVVLLGVNSDAPLEFAKEAKQSERLGYRMWWDGHGEKPRMGPISRNWSISGWPTIYVIDEEGFIRYRDPRQEKLITAVKVLLAELKMKERARR